MTKTTTPKRNPYLHHYAPFVVKGVRFLDKNVPGWTRPNKLAISDLDLSSGTRCVLGQLAAKSALTGAGYELDTGRWTPDYCDAINAMEIDGLEFGFNSRCLDPDSENDAEDYDALNHLWAHAIRLTRRGEKVTVAALRAIA